MEKYRAIPAGYMLVGEMAKKSGVNTNTLRYYDKEGLLTPSSESEGGYRLYTDKDMMRLVLILTMKQLGFTLDEIKKHLVSLHNPNDMVKALTEHETAIQKKIEILSKLLQEIKALKAEVERIQTMDFKRYYAILQNLRMGNEHYWAIKHFDEEVLNSFEKYFDEDSASALINTMNCLMADVVRLKNEGASPDSDKGQAWVAKYWEALTKMAGGDKKLLRKFVENYTSIDLNNEEAKIHMVTQDFIRVALNAYFTKKGYDPFE